MGTVLASLLLSAGTGRGAVERVRNREKLFAKDMSSANQGHEL